MFDTMTMTKIVGGFCGTFLVFLLGNWAAEGLYNIGPGEGEHGPREQAYTVAVADTGSTDAAPQVSFADVYAKADAAKGEKVFSKCKACHKVDGNNAVGPHLNDVVGRAVASVEGFAYSDALKALGGDWTPERLDEWLTSPKAFAPGTKMSFAGLPKIEDRADVIAYLATQK